jgi:hypothetical protein
VIIVLKSIFRHRQTPFCPTRLVPLKCAVWNSPPLTLCVRNWVLTPSCSSKIPSWVGTGYSSRHHECNIRIHKDAFSQNHQCRTYLGLLCSLVCSTVLVRKIGTVGGTICKLKGSFSFFFALDLHSLLVAPPNHFVHCQQHLAPGVPTYQTCKYDPFFDPF